jgi:NADPH:quinone reductase-like Zn-dependent oxidoreductase
MMLLTADCWLKVAKTSLCCCCCFVADGRRHTGTDDCNRDMRIEGRTFLVTGGASGLGEGVTRELVARGAHVVVLDLDDEKGPKLAEELGKNVLYVKTDITDESTFFPPLSLGSVPALLTLQT